MRVAMSCLLTLKAGGQARFCVSFFMSSSSMPSTYSFSSRLLMQSLRLRYRYCYKGNFRAHFVWNMYGVQHQHVPKSPKAQNNLFQNIQKHYFLFLGVTFNGGMSFAVPCCSFLCRIRLQKVRGGKFVMERPVYHHCSHLLPTVLHTTQTLTQNQITLPDVAQDISSNAWGYFPPRQMLLQAGWLGRLEATSANGLRASQATNFQPGQERQTHKQFNFLFASEKMGIKWMKI